MFRKRQLDDDSHAFVVLVQISDEFHDLSDAIIFLIDIDTDIIEFTGLVPIIFGVMILSENDDRQSYGFAVCFLMLHIGGGRIIVSQENDGDVRLPAGEELRRLGSQFLLQLQRQFLSRKQHGDIQRLKKLPKDYSQSGRFLKELFEERFEDFHAIELFPRELVPAEMPVRSGRLEDRLAQSQSFDDSFRTQVEMLSYRIDDFLQIGFLRAEAVDIDIQWLRHADGVRNLQFTLVA